MQDILVAAQGVLEKQWADSTIKADATTFSVDCQVVGQLQTSMVCHDDRSCRPTSFHPVGASGHIKPACGGPRSRKDRLEAANRVGGGVAQLPHCPHNKGQ